VLDKQNRDMKRSISLIVYDVDGLNQWEPQAESLQRHSHTKHLWLSRTLHHTEKYKLNAVLILRLRLQ